MLCGSTRFWFNRLHVLFEFLQRFPTFKLNNNNMRWSPFLGIPISLALLSFFLFQFFPLKSPQNPLPPVWFSPLSSIAITRLLFLLIFFLVFTENIHCSGAHSVQWNWSSIAHSPWNSRVLSNFYLIF